MRRRLEDLQKASLHHARLHLVDPDADQLPVDHPSNKASDALEPADPLPPKGDVIDPKGDLLTGTEFGGCGSLF